MNCWSDNKKKNIPALQQFARSHCSTAIHDYLDALETLAAAAPRLIQPPGPARPSLKVHGSIFTKLSQVQTRRPPAELSTVSRRHADTFLSKTLEVESDLGRCSAGGAVKLWQVPLLQMDAMWKVWKEGRKSRALL